MKVASRDRQHVYLRRPIQLLYPLEICETEVLGTDSGDSPASSPDAPVSAPVEECDAPTLKEPEKCPTRGELLGPRATELT